MHYTFSVSVYPKKKSDHRTFWFQNGELTDSPVWYKMVSSNKSFRTTKKFVTFLRWLEKYYPDTVAEVVEFRSGGRTQYVIPMGDDWKDYFKEKE